MDSVDSIDGGGGMWSEDTVGIQQSIIMVLVFSSVSQRKDNSHPFYKNPIVLKHLLLYSELKRKIILIFYYVI